MSLTKKECEQETKIRKAIQYLAIAENYLDNVSREYEIPNCTFLNQAFKEVQQVRMELFCFLGEFDVNKIQEHGVKFLSPSLRILKNIKRSEKVCQKQIINK